MTRFMISAPTSGAGKTTIALALMRILKRNGLVYQPAKSGPDYIDPRFHEAAAKQPSINIDAWAMPSDQILSLAGQGHLVIEGAMGLFDGAGLLGHGSTAELAKQLSIPIILVVDAAKTSHSIAALVQGFVNFDDNIKIAGVILNRVGTERHLKMLIRALNAIKIPVMGYLPRSVNFTLAERHLGLVQAGEHENLDSWIDLVADALETTLDLEAILALTGPTFTKHTIKGVKPPAQKIAIAQDRAFEFTYTHMLKEWRAAGAELSFFSPLADDIIPAGADFVFLPGGYPELYAGKLSTANRFRSSVQKHALKKPVYGECGGYMVLGDGLIDKYGDRHKMLGLLRLETSFQNRELHLGYRQLTPLTSHFELSCKGHEFHYAKTLQAEGPALFNATDADGTDLADMGLFLGNTYGSFAHIISGI